MYRFKYGLSLEENELFVVMINLAWARSKRFFSANDVTMTFLLTIPSLETSVKNSSILSPVR